MSWEIKMHIQSLLIQNLAEIIAVTWIPVLNTVTLEVCSACWRGSAQTASPAVKVALPPTRQQRAAHGQEKGQWQQKHKPLKKALEDISTFSNVSRPTLVSYKKIDITILLFAVSHDQSCFSHTPYLLKTQLRANSLYNQGWQSTAQDFWSSKNLIFSRCRSTYRILWQYGALTAL